MGLQQCNHLLQLFGDKRCSAALAATVASGPSYTTAISAALLKCSTMRVDYFSKAVASAVVHDDSLLLLLLLLLLLPQLDCTDCGSD
jgi:hypothetical protein